MRRTDMESPFSPHPLAPVPHPAGNILWQLFLKDGVTDRVNEFYL